MHHETLTKGYLKMNCPFRFGALWQCAHTTSKVDYLISARDGSQITINPRINKHIKGTKGIVED